MNTIISTQNLSKRYDGIYRVRDVDLTVKEGDIYGFLGPNGAGKTTTLKMLLGLTKPSDGKVVMFDKDLAKHRRWILSRTGRSSKLPHTTPI